MMRIRKDVLVNGIVAVAMLGTLVYNLVNYAYFREKLVLVTPRLPPAVRVHLPVVLTTGELALVAGLCLGSKRRMWRWVAYYCLFAATAFLVYWVAQPWEPDCTCEGLRRLAARVKSENLFCLVRNVLLMGVLWFAGQVRQPRADLERPDMTPCSGGPSQVSREAGVLHRSGRGE